MTIDTERLVLRELQEADAEAIQEYAGSEIAVQYLSWGPHPLAETVAFVREAIERGAQEPRTSFELAVVERSSSSVIGTASLWLHEEKTRNGEIGYCLVPRVWGHGFGTEAAGAVLSMGFRTLDLHRIWATSDPRNVASVRLLTSLGMGREGYMREEYQVRGRWRDSVLFAMLEQDFAAKWGDAALGTVHH